jgi:hypothetical protein
MLRSPTSNVKWPEYELISKRSFSPYSLYEDYFNITRGTRPYPQRDECRTMKNTNSYLILKDKIAVSINLRRMNRPSTRTAHVPTTPCASTKSVGLFKLSCLKSLNDTNIEINLAKWDLVTTNNKSNQVKATQYQLKARSRDGQSKGGDLSKSKTTVQKM